MKFFSMAELQQQYMLAPQIYSAHVTSLAAGATSPQNVTIRENAPFALLSIDGWSHLQGTFGTKTYCNVQITDNGRNRTLFDQRLPLDILNGFNAKDAQPMELPYLFDGLSSVTIEIVSVEASQASEVWVLLVGANCYKRS